MAILPTSPPDQPASRGTVTDGDGSERRYTTVSWRPSWKPKWSFRSATTATTETEPGTRFDMGYLVALTLAFLGIIAVSGVTMYVSYDAQLHYTDLVKGETTPVPPGSETSLAVQLAAAAWDVAAVSFALMGLATAMRGDNALRSRVGNLACALASVLMNGARLDVPDDAGMLTWMGHILVWMGPSLLYVGATDTIVWEIQRRSMERRGLPLEQASIWSVLSILLNGLLGVVLWLVRLVFSPWKTLSLFRTWYIAEVPYAPGRTLEGDKAREALEEAARAKGFAEEVERQSATAIAEAEADYERRANEAEKRAEDEIARIRADEAKRADEAIRVERDRASKGIRAERERANSAVAESEAAVQGLAEKHGREREELQGQYDQALEQVRADYDQQVADLTATVSDRDRDLERLRSELGRVRAEATQGAEYGRELESTRTRLSTEQHRRLQAEQQVSDARREQQELFRRLSGRGQVEYLYTRLEREGDSRYGDQDRFHEVAQEFVDRHGVALTPHKAAHYIRTFVSESGPAVSSGTDVATGSMESGL